MFCSRFKQDSMASPVPRNMAPSDDNHNPDKPEKSHNSPLTASALPRTQALALLRTASSIPANITAIIRGSGAPGCGPWTNPQRSLPGCPRWRSQPLSQQCCRNHSQSWLV